MGWLDNSTNNIILDAVLTDYGRQALARNNGSFNITKFALGDDEVNYGIIQKFGRTIGREKIEKNTPVFEAFTNQNLALKNKLISIPVPLVYLPNLKLEGDAKIISLGLNNGSNSKTVNIVLERSSNDSSLTLEPTIADANFDVYYPSIFVSIDNKNSTPGQTSLDAVRTAHTTISTTLTSESTRTA